MAATQAASKQRPRIQEVTVPDGFEQVELVLPRGKLIPKGRRNSLPRRIGEVTEVRLALTELGQLKKPKEGTLDMTVAAGVHVVRLILPSGKGKQVQDRDTFTRDINPGVDRVVVSIPPSITVQIPDLDQVIAVLEGMSDERQGGMYRNEMAFERLSLQPQGDESDLPSQLARYVAGGGDLFKLALQAVQEASRTHALADSTQRRYAKLLMEELAKLATPHKRSSSLGTAVQRLFKIGDK